MKRRADHVECIPYQSYAVVHMRLTKRTQRQVRVETAIEQEIGSLTDEG